MSKSTDTIFDSLWFRLNDGELDMPVVKSLGTFKSASLLKPLYAWAAYDLFQKDDNLDQWSILARPSIVYSDNATTTEIWNKYSDKKIFDELARKTDENWQYMDGYQTWGSIEIDAHKVCRAYAKLMISSEASARQVFDWMKEVDDVQAFGMKSLLEKRLMIDQANIAAKAGWFVDEAEARLRTHIILIAEIEPSRLIGLTVLSTKQVSRSFIEGYLNRYNHGQEVLSLHTDLITEEIEAEVSTLLIEAMFL